MFLAEKMDRLSVLVLKEDLDAALEEIAAAGVLHPARLEELGDWAKELSVSGVTTLASEYDARRRRLTELITLLQKANSLVPDTSPAGHTWANLTDLDAVIANASERVNPLMEERARLLEKRMDREDLRGQINQLLPSGMPIRSLMHSTLLTTSVGVVPRIQMEKLNRLLSTAPSIILPYKEDQKNCWIICVALKRDKMVVDQALREAAFQELVTAEDTSQLTTDATDSLDQEISVMTTRLDEIARALSEAAPELLPALLETREKANATLVLLRMKDFCRLTEKTCALTGWVPHDKTPGLLERLSQRTHGRALVELTPAEEIPEMQAGTIDVPVSLHHPPALQPFEIIIDNYATPSYRMVDPTLFVAITFLFMFGMMFGDVGHGLVLLAAGLFMAIRSSKLRNFGLLMMYAGASSMVFGFLYGSLFGLETVLPALWVRPLEGINDLFKIAILFGAMVISLGIILNTINAIRSGRFVESLFENSGLLAGIIYWSCIGMGMKYMASGEPPAVANFIVGFIVVLLVIFFLHGPILKLFKRREHAFHDGIFTYIMEGLIEIMELFMGYLANTVSFIRVAAFGLAHAGLFIAVFSMENILNALPGGRVWSWMDIILGNILIVSFEGLVVTIQALRLEFYEFFGKFFKDAGAKYAPLGFTEPRLTNKHGKA